MKKTKKITKPKDPDYYIYLEVKNKIVHDDSEGSGYERTWNKEYDSDVLGVHKECYENKYSERFAVSQEVLDSDNIGVVWVIHTDGDSFGNSSGDISIACITDRQKILEEVLEAIKNDDDYDRLLPWEKNKTKRLLTFKEVREKYKETGSYFSEWESWLGYFNTIESIEHKIFESKPVKKLK